jgi:predicted nucleic acid-binding protein
MADYFFDTSALVKRHVIETGSAWVRSLVRARAAHDLYIARITAVEVTSAITRRQHSGHLSPAQAGAMLGHFRRHLARRYHVIELTPALFDDAARAARKHRLRAYDAVQLAVDLDLHRRHQDAGLGPVTLVSADQGLNTAAVAEGLSVNDPNSYP